MIRDFPAVAREQCGVFSTLQARADGWTSSALRHATVSGRLRGVRRGAYQVADLTSISEIDEFEQSRWHHAAKAIGAVLTTPGAAASHSTAAVLRGMPLIFIPADSCVTVRSWNTGDVPGVHLHRCSGERMPPVGEVPCTSFERTAIDLAREHGVAPAVVALDYLLHSEHSTPVGVAAALQKCVRWPGVRRAREALEFSDHRSESVLESRSRLKLREFGLPQPELQRAIGNEWGGFVARVDFYWDELGVVGEADGDVKYDGSKPRALLAEKKRQGVLEDLGLEVVRWDNADLRDFAAVAARIHRGFGRARRRSPADRRWTLLPPL